MQHHWGEKLSNGFYHKLLDEGKITDPTKIIDEEVTILEAIYFEAYREIASCRSWSGEIPFTSIVEYFKIFLSDSEDFEDFLFLIRKMESAERECSKQEQEKVKTDGNVSNKKNSSPNSPIRKGSS